MFMLHVDGHTSVFRAGFVGPGVGQGFANGQSGWPCMEGQ
jgi:hypothetical protein